jgi:hypothetical protein
MFGRSIEGEKVAYWGARAIYKGYSDDCHIDLLADRQGGENISDGFLYWLNHRALPWLRQRVKQISLATDDAQVLTLDEFCYHLEASTNASYGYLYIGAVERPVTPAEPRRNPASGKEEKVFLCEGNKVVWAAEGDIPLPGTNGNVRINNIGPGTVVGYHTFRYGNDGHLLLCLRVELEKPPTWWKKQTLQYDIEKALKEHVIAHSFRHPDQPDKDSLKRFKKDYKLPPAIVWDCDFDTKAA